MKMSYYHKSLLPIFCAALLIAFGVSVNSASAAELSNSIISSTKPLSKDQTKKVDRFIKENIAKLNKSKDNTQVAAVRAQLLAPLKSKNAGSGFTESYSNALIAPLVKELSSDSLSVRINSIVVIAQLNLEASKLLPPAVKALSDDSPGVRYWGAKIITIISESKSISLTDKQKSEIKAVLKKQISKESSPSVLGSILAAMAASGGSQGRAAVLKALQARVKYHKSHPKSSYLAAQTALRQIYVNLVKEASNNQDISAPLKKLAKLTVEYYILAAEQLKKNQKNLTEKDQAGKLAIIKIAEPILGYALGKIDSDAKAPGSIQNAIKNKDWDTINKVAQSWKSIFSD